MCAWYETTWSGRRDPYGGAAEGEREPAGVQHVREQILEGRWPGRALLSENEVAEELGMSRTPVRAAFGQLEAEGYLKLYPKRGAIVVPVSPREAEEVIETRWVIERHAIEQAAHGLGAELTARSRTPARA